MAALIGGLPQTQFTLITTEAINSQQATPPIEFAPSSQAEKNEPTSLKLRRITTTHFSTLGTKEHQTALSIQQIRWSAILFAAGEKNLACRYRGEQCCPLFPRVPKKTDMSVLPSVPAASVMQFVGYITPLASVNRHWRHMMHGLTSFFIPTIIHRVDWLKELFETKLNADANFLLNDLVMQTIRELKANFALKKEEIRTRMDNKLCRLLKREGQPIRFQYYERLVDDPKVMKFLIKRAPELLAIAPPSVKGDVEFITELVQISGISLKDAAEELRANPKVVLLAVRQNPEAYAFALGEAQTNETIIKETLQRNGSMLGHAPTKIRQSLEYLIIAISSQCPDSTGRGLAVLQYTLIENLWEHREIRKILELVLLHNRNGETVMAHRLLPQDLWEDRDFNLLAAIHNPEVELQYTPFQHDFEFDQAVFMRNPRFLWQLLIDDSVRLIPETMKVRLLTNRELVLALFMIEAPFSPQHETLIRQWNFDTEIMDAAILNLTNPLASPSPSRDGIALKEAHPTLFDNIPFIKKIVSKVGVALQYIPLPFRLKYPAEVFELALKNNGAAIAWVPAEILTVNPQFYPLALRTFGLLWRFLSASAQLDLANARIAIKADYKVFPFFPLEFRSLAEFVEIAVKEDASMILSASPDWLADPWKFEMALSWNGLVLEFGLPELKLHYHFNKVAVLENYEAYQFVSDVYKTHRGILLSADLNPSNPRSSASHYRLILANHRRKHMAEHPL